MFFIFKYFSYNLSHNGCNFDNQSWHFSCILLFTHALPTLLNAYCGSFLKEIIIVTPVKVGGHELVACLFVSYYNLTEILVTKHSVF